MFKKIQFVFIIISVALILIWTIDPRISPAMVDDDSIFFEAQLPASELDLMLLRVSLSWNRIFINNPTAEIRSEFPLITKVGAAADLSYHKDKIHFSAWITKLKGFLSLNEIERKNLVYKLLATVKKNLFTVTIHRKKKINSDSILQNRDIRLQLILNYIYEDDRGNRIRKILPYNLIGQAGYLNGESIFSESYYLKLRVKDGRAVFSGPDKVIIERDVTK